MQAERASRTKQQLVRDFRTHEILDGARRVIAMRGYAEASMERIAREAGVAKGTLYLYFESKDQLLARAFERVLTELVENARAATNREHGAVAKLREIVRVGLEHSAENQAFYQGMREPREEGRSPSFWTPEARQRMRSYESFIADVLRYGVRGGELRHIDPERAAQTLLSMVTGTAITRIKKPEVSEIEADISLTLDFFLNGVGSGDRS